MKNIDDAKKIEDLGGATEVAKILKLDLKKGGAQRVHNWIKRGIPPKVKVDNPEIFLKNL